MNKLKEYSLATVNSICLSGNEFWSNAALKELDRRKKNLRRLELKKQKEKEKEDLPF